MSDYKWHSFEEANNLAAVVDGMCRLITHECEPPAPPDPKWNSTYRCPECGTQWTWVKPTNEGYWKDTWFGFGRKWISKPEPGWWFCFEKTYRVERVHGG